MGNYSQEYINNLNERQKSGKVHPYTCSGHNISECNRSKAYERRHNGDGSEVPYTDENEGVLIATKDGWICPCGKYTQKFS